MANPLADLLGEAVSENGTQDSTALAPSARLSLDDPSFATTKIVVATSTATLPQAAIPTAAMSASSLAGGDVVDALGLETEYPRPEVEDHDEFADEPVSLEIGSAAVAASAGDDDFDDDFDGAFEPVPPSTAARADSAPNAPVYGAQYSAAMPSCMPATTASAAQEADRLALAAAAAEARARAEQAEAEREAAARAAAQEEREVCADLSRQCVAFPPGELLGSRGRWPGVGHAWRHARHRSWRRMLTTCRADDVPC